MILVPVLLGHPEAVQQRQYVYGQQEDAEEADPVVADAFVLVALQAVNAAAHPLTGHHDRLLQRITASCTAFSFQLLVVLTGTYHFLLRCFHS